MNVTVQLPPEFELRWKRLLSVYGPEADALAMSAIELLWEKYQHEVVESEIQKKQLRKNIRVTKSKLANVGRAIQDKD